jgi:hypothetical protein
MANRKIRGETALKSAADTISYEYRTFQQAYDVIFWCRAQISPSPRVGVIRVLALEAALLHARILRNFFLASGGADDILITDFLARKPRLKLTVLRSQRIRTRLNKLLAHPSYKRPGLAKQWPISQIRAEITTSWHTFLQLLNAQSPKRRSFFR